LTRRFADESGRDHRGSDCNYFLHRCGDDLLLLLPQDTGFYCHPNL